MQFAKISGGQKEVTTGGTTGYETWLQLTLEKDVCVSEAVHDYAPEFGEKFSCKKDGDCTCASKNDFWTAGSVDTCKMATFTVSGGSGKQENQKPDCKTGNVFKFTMTEKDASLAVGKDMFQNMMLISPDPASGMR